LSDSAAWLARAEQALLTASKNLENRDYGAAVNRAYYSIYNASRAALITVGQPRLSMSKTHSGLRTAFNEHVIKAGKAHKSLATIYAAESNRRLAADYEGREIEHAEAAEAIINASAFLNAVTEIEI
jgi:uncharacterized protein (UPF0332 family)